MSARLAEEFSLAKLEASPLDGNVENDIVYVREHDFRHLACSGATVLPDGNAGTPVDVGEQFLGGVLSEFPTVRSAVKLISVTGGANDINFARESLFGEHLCAPGPQFIAWLAEQAAQVRGKLGSIISAAIDDERTHLVATDYYNPFNRESAFFDILFAGNHHCRALQTAETSARPVRRDKYKAAMYLRTVDVIRTLNQAIEAAIRPYVSSGRVRLAGVGGDFVGWESARRNCGAALPETDHTLIQYLGFRLASPAGVLRAAALRELERGDDCFHPTEYGAAAIASRVDDAAILMLSGQAH